MRTRKLTLKLGAAALTCTALSLATSQALAAEYWLKAATTEFTIDGTVVVMWGYASCTTTIIPFDTCGPVTVPGPTLTVPPGDSILKVNLQNGLTVPTSLVINGLIKPMAPVWTTDAESRRRVRSFDKEVLAGSDTGSAPYEWINVKPGTYLYQSGTQVQVQVQMGLYGAATKNAQDAAAGPPPVRAQAYPGAAFEYDNQATLLYSEIDPDLHAAIATGTYGTAPGPTSTINYAPKYFLVNGQPFPKGSPVIAPPVNGTTLLRLLNAGLTTHVPMIQGTHWTVVAEDGKPYPYRLTQYTALLPAAKTVDVLLTPDIGGGVYAIMDRRLSLSNNGLSDGGMLAFLQYGALGVAGGGGSTGNLAPVTLPDEYDSIVGVTLNIGAPAGVLANDSDPDRLPMPIKAVAAAGLTAGGGTYTLNTNGSFTYTPLAGFTGSDSFTYQVTDGQALAPGTVKINLTSPSAPALGSLDSFGTDGPSLGGSWSQQVGTETSAPDIGVSGGTAVANTTALGGLAIWNAAPFGPTQGAGFTSGGPPGAKAYLVLKATGGTAIAPANYVRVGCEGGQVVVSTMMGGSNTSAYVKQAAFGSCTGSGGLSAVVDAKGLVTAFVGVGFQGGVQLPDVAAWKGGGRIGIQLTTGGATADNFAGGNL